MLLSADYAESLAICVSVCCRYLKLSEMSPTLGGHSCSAQAAGEENLVSLMCEGLLIAF